MPPAVSKWQLEDQWAWVEIGEPFPDGPMRVKGEQNQYVALWYKHGKPVCGRAWNNGGVVECSFPYRSAELTGKHDLGGKIQILTYETWKEPTDAWKLCGYWYEWVPWQQRRKDNVGLVHCGDSAPILMKGDDGEMYSGNIEISTETVTISHGKKTETRNTNIAQLLTIVRNFTDPGPAPEAPPPALIYDDIWSDFKEGDDFSRVRCPIAAMGRPLKGVFGARANCSVALWYQHGQPVMGAMWNEGGKIRALFGWGGNEYKDKIGNIQVLAYDPKRAGFKISWQKYSDATKPRSEWRPVKVKDCAPCVIVDRSGVEHLGRVLVSEEKAFYPDGGKEHSFVGPQVQNFYVLCRTN